MAKGGFDYSEFKKLYREMENTQKDLSKFLEEFLIRQALVALRLVRPRTPVDTGTLRRMWQISDVKVYATYMVVYLVNPMEYASYMEHGFTYNTAEGTKRFEGFHMAELSILQVQQQLPAKFQREFTQWLKARGWT